MTRVSYLTPDEQLRFDQLCRLRDNYKSYAATAQREIDIIRDRARKRAAKASKEGIGDG
jgi:hypothetical protein